ncbi:MAG: diacylglycerol kinase family protein [Verrucomicrobiota bacterium]
MSEECGMETPRRYPLIFNPRARSQKGGKMMKFLMAHGGRFAMHATNHANEARELAARFAAQGESVVIAAGGDGTINEVVNGLSGSSTTLGILPAGTINVFARELGIPCDSFERAFEVIERGLIREVDVFLANGFPFIQMAGVGFDAKVIEETTWESKKLLGPLAYLLAAVKVLGKKPPDMTITLADGSTDKGVAVLAGNGSLYGGPFRFFRNAHNHDSKIDVIVYKEAGYRLVLDSLRGIACGGVDLSASTSYFQTESFTVRADDEMPVEVDGEWIGRFSEVEFRESSCNLKVIAPDPDSPLTGSFADAFKSLLQWPRRQPKPELQTTRTR